MENAQDTVFKAASIGTLAVCVALTAFILLLVLFPSVFIGTAQERLTYIAAHSAIGALPWFAACVWATAEIPVALGLFFIVRKKHPGSAVLGAVFYLICVAVRFVAYIVLITTVGGATRGEIMVSTFTFLDALGLNLEGISFLLLSVALLLFGFPLAKEEGLLRKVGWLFVADAVSLLLGGPIKMLVSIGMVFPAVVNMVATVLVGPIPVVLAIVAYGLLIPVFMSMRSVNRSAT